MATYENNDYASKGVGTAGLTLGVIGTALASGVLNGNGLGATRPRVRSTSSRRRTTKLPCSRHSSIPTTRLPRSLNACPISKPACLPTKRLTRCATRSSVTASLACRASSTASAHRSCRTSLSLRVGVPLSCPRFRPSRPSQPVAAPLPPPPPPARRKPRKKR